MHINIHGNHHGIWINFKSNNVQDGAKFMFLFVTGDTQFILKSKEACLLRRIESIVRGVECDFVFMPKGEGIFNIVFQVHNRSYINSNPYNETHESHKYDL